MLETALSALLRRIVKFSRIVLQGGHRHSEPLKYRAHPVSVASGEIIIHSNQVNAFAGKRVQVGRQR